MRKLVLALVVALAVAAPAQAGGGDGGGEAERPKAPRAKELRISGAIVRLSEEAVAVENRVGDAVLTCLVPERLAEELQRFEVGDAVRMRCLRWRGRRAVLLKLQPLEAKGPDEHAEKPPAHKPPDKPHPAEEVRVYGAIAAISVESVTVRGEAGSHTCRVPAALAEKIARFAVGDAVKMMCRGAELTYLEKTG